MLKIPRRIAVFALALFSAVVEARAETKEFLSPVYTIDRIYRSMEGPQSAQAITLTDGPPELLWITGFRTDMVEADGKTPSLPEFMCHVNVDYDVHRHNTLMGSPAGGRQRVLTLSQGQTEVHFPEGFGMPVISNEPLSVNTQVLNHNLAHPHLEVRHRVTFYYMRDSELKKPMQALYNTTVEAMKLIEGTDGNYGMSGMNGMAAVARGAESSRGEVAPNAYHGDGCMLRSDGHDRQFSGHWVVKPGREVNHTDVTQDLALPYDTTLHFAGVHLHPYAESLEFRDLTTRKTLFKSHARGFDHKIGLASVEYLSSAEGIALYRHHHYELISVYNNTTSVNKDSMAVMNLFLTDKTFQKPKWLTETAASQVPEKGRGILLKTSLGDMTISLDSKDAPATVAHFAELAEAGAYDTVRILRIIPRYMIQFGGVLDATRTPTPEQMKLIRQLPLEVGDAKHVRGILSMAHDEGDPNSGESSFFILLGDAPQMDGRYTVFGKVVTGTDTLDALEKTPRDENNHPKSVIQIKKAELTAPDRSKS